MVFEKIFSNVSRYLWYETLFKEEFGMGIIDELGGIGCRFKLDILWERIVVKIFRSKIDLKGKWKEEFLEGDK